MRPTAVIAEDEPLLREELQDALAHLWPELEVVAAVGDGMEAVRALETQHPRVLFLDIQMPGISGLEVARLASGRCHVVFVTAFEQYAVAAFEQGAIDYIMKPFQPARLATAIARLRARLDSAPSELAGLVEALGRKQAPARFLSWITVGEGRAVRLITVDEICYFQSDNKYTSVFTATGEFLIHKSLRQLQEELDPELFRQIHRGTLVNMRAIATVQRDLRGHLQVRLKQRSESLQVSNTFASLFRQM